MDRNSPYFAVHARAIRPRFNHVLRRCRRSEPPKRRVSGVRLEVDYVSGKRQLADPDCRGARQRHRFPGDEKNARPVVIFPLYLTLTPAIFLS